MYSYEDVMNFVREEDVKFIRLTFFDAFGTQKNISVLADELPRAFESGMTFDASAIAGFQQPGQPDLILFPDPSTINIIPWRPSHGRVLRLYCDIKYPGGQQYEKDCRHILRMATEKAKAQGISFLFGSEMEFYLFKLDQDGSPTRTPLDMAGYMDIAPEDRGENIRRDICLTLEKMGIVPESSHHEKGPGQNEIDFHCGDPLAAADNSATFKWVVRTLAATNGLHADFSPLPLPDCARNSMHINLSCQNPDSRNKLSFMIAGIESHLREMTLFLNPLAESYKRPKNQSIPWYAAWGNDDRNLAIRVPQEHTGNRWIELRSPDPMANPYLAFTLIIHAALDGIEKEAKPSAPVQGSVANIVSSTSSVPAKLPESLEEAAKVSEASDFIRSIIPESFIKVYANQAAHT